MLHLPRLAALAALALLAMALPAAAQDLTGRYVGVAETEGTTVNLQQDGTSLTGQLLGTNVGELTGTVTGDSFTGAMELVGGLTLTFEGKATADGIELLIADTEGSTLAQFKRDEGVVLDVAALPPHLYYFSDGTAFGPLSLPEVVDRYDAGDITGTDRVWTAGQPGWAALNTLPDFAGVLPPPIPGAVVAVAVESDPLRGVVQATLDAQFSFISLPDRMLITDCAVAVLGGISETDRTRIVDTNFDLSEAEMADFETRNPGVMGDVLNCAAPGQTGGPPRSSIELLDGRILAVSGAGPQSLDIVGGGVQFTVGTTTVTLIGGDLAINEAAPQPVSFARSLEVVVADDGTTTLVIDP